MYAWMCMCVHKYKDHNPLYTFVYVSVSVYVCLCSHTCVHVHICGICMYMSVLTPVGMCGGQQLRSGYLLSHLSVWDRFSQSWSWPLCLGWLISKPWGSSCLCSLVLGLHACVSMPGFSLAAGIQTGLCVCKESTLPTGPTPQTLAFERGFLVEPGAYWFS